MNYSRDAATFSVFLTMAFSAAFGYLVILFVDYWVLQLLLMGFVPLVALVMGFSIVEGFLYLLNKKQRTKRILADYNQMKKAEEDAYAEFKHLESSVREAAFLASKVVASKRELIERAEAELDYLRAKVENIGEQTKQVEEIVEKYGYENSNEDVV